MKYIVRGVVLVLGTPKLWRFIVQPMLVGAVAFLCFAVGSYFLIVPRLQHRLDQVIAHNSAWAAFASLITVGFYVTMLVLTSGFLYLTFVSFFSASMWERLSFEIEVMATGKRIEAKLPARSIVADSIQRGLFAIGVTLLSLCCGWTFFGIPAILFAGFLGLHDYTSSAFLRRGILFAGQRRYIRHLPNRFGFMAVGGLLTLVPVVNVLMLPCLVAGGTLMVIEGEGKGWTFPPPSLDHGPDSSRR